ncbi:MAG: hypothetical protein ACT4QA_05870 [Panacagrimonas sp.]
MRDAVILRALLLVLLMAAVFGISGRVQAQGLRVEPGEIPAGLNADQWSSIRAQIRHSKLAPSGRVASSPLAGRAISEEAKLTVEGDGSFGENLGHSIAVDGNTMVVGRPELGGSSNQGAAFVFVRSGSQWSQQAKLVVADATQADSFGSAVAIHGDTVLVGAPNRVSGTDPTDPGSAVTGAVYVFVRSGSNWTRQAQLEAPDGVRGSRFGRSVSISSDTALIGTGDARIPATVGSAYVFVRSGASWSQQARLLAFEGIGGFEFGLTVAVSGDTALVGARPVNFVSGVEVLGVVFVRRGTQWRRQATLEVAAPIGSSSSLGASVALTGNTAVIGTSEETVGGNVEQGSAYVFVRVGETWTQQARLVPADGFADQGFGASVAASGDTVVVGMFDDGRAVPNPGSAYVFVRNGPRWTQQARLLAADGADGDTFGFAVSVSGSTAVAGAPLQDLTHGDQGSAFVFVGPAGRWTQQAQLATAEGATSDGFGFSVAASGDVLVVGAPDDDIDGGRFQGSAYVFARSGDAWVQQARLLAGDGMDSDLFGLAVAVSGETAVIGSPTAGAGFGNRPGVAYVFVRTGGSWVQQARLVAADGAHRDSFGLAVAIDGDALAVGVRDDEIAGNAFQGSAYVFVRTAGVWSQQAKLQAADGAEFDSFGNAIAIARDTVVAGAAGSQSSTGGAAYVFVRQASRWTQQAKLEVAGDSEGDGLGTAVAVSGDTVVLGAPGHDVRGNFEQGAAYVFTRNGTVWRQQARLTIADGAAQDSLGTAVAVAGDFAVVGAGFALAADGGRDGAAYLFARTGGAWTERARFLASDGMEFDGFGFAVALSGDTAVVGADSDDNASGGDAGAAYVFRADPGSEPPPGPDTTPDRFNFRDRSGVSRNVPVTSNAIIVSGLGVDTSADLAVTRQVGGDVSYSINGSAFRRGPASVRNGDRVRMRNTIPAGRRSVNATLGIGGIRDTWSTTAGP